MWWCQTWSGPISVQTDSLSTVPLVVAMNLSSFWIRQCPAICGSTIGWGVAAMPRANMDCLGNPRHSAISCAHVRQSNLQTINLQFLFMFLVNLFGFFRLRRGFDTWNIFWIIFFGIMHAFRFNGLSNIPFWNCVSFLVIFIRLNRY